VEEEEEVMQIQTELMTGRQPERHLDTMSIPQERVYACERRKDTETAYNT